MTSEEAIQVLQTALTSPFIYGEYADAIDMAIEALSADTISREEAIHAIDLCRERKNKEIDELRTKWLEAEQRADRPQGEWVLVCDGGRECDNLYRCSHCGREMGCEEYDKPKFCGECGADMRGEKNG